MRNLYARNTVMGATEEGGGEAMLSLPFLNTPLHIILTMILYENVKPIVHALLHPICVLSHLICA